MAGKLLDYNLLVETALRGAVREAIKRASEFGLPGNHHFYITFRTDQEGVDIPEYLHTRYPEEMTIVLQHQYWGLEPGEDAFQVTLSFNKVPERLVIPYAAITAFADPSVQFGLQFRVSPNPDFRPQPAGTEAAAETLPEAGNPAADEADAAAGERKTGDVVALDAFRKKKT
ncbi:ClpXP protease specificity-enhancing factor SspB [Ferrovibrio sp.]|uniref:SspB family protein n=1 Tax=Ferrovibrio sp. TaxID=1917215 RepID=UPI00311FA6E2